MPLCVGRQVDDSTGSGVNWLELIALTARILVSTAVDDLDLRRPIRRHARLGRFEFNGAAMNAKSSEFGVWGFGFPTRNAKPETPELLPSAEIATYLITQFYQANECAVYPDRMHRGPLIPFARSDGSPSEARSVAGGLCLPIGGAKPVLCSGGRVGSRVQLRISDCRLRIEE